MLPGQMKNPPPLEAPATMHPVSESAPLEIKVSITAQRAVDAKERLSRELDLIISPGQTDNGARWRAGPIGHYLVLFDGNGMSRDDFLPIGNGLAFRDVAEGTACPRLVA